MSDWSGISEKANMRIFSRGVLVGEWEWGWCSSTSAIGFVNLDEKIKIILRTKVKFLI